MIHRFNLCIAIYSKSEKARYEYDLMQLSSKMRRLNFVFHYSKNLLALRSSVIQCPASRFDGIYFLWFNILKIGESLI